VHNFFMYV